LKLVLDSPEIKAKGYTLSKLHAELVKKKKPLVIQNTSFGLAGGTVGISGEIVSEEKTAADLKVKLKSLSVATLSGKKGMPARLSGNLRIKNSDMQNSGGYHGGGNISVGPIPLPQVDLKNKVRVAEILTAGTSVGSMVNVGMLSNSANVIGKQINQVKATVSFGGGNVTLRPFSMSNGHFHASGNGKVIGQKNISGSGTFTLNRGVTRRLITDPLLRSALTDGKGALSFPFSISGPLADPQVAVNSGYLKSQMAKATILLIQKQALSGIQPEKILNQALKGTPLGDKNSPLGQFLGTQTTSPQKSSEKTPRRKASRKQEPKSPEKQLLDNLIFGR